MKRFIKYALMGVAALALLPSCKEEEVYNTSVTREFNLMLDGERYINKTEDSHVYGDWNVYIYHPDGKLKGNYKTQYRFALENGDYKVFSIYSNTVLNFFEPSTNLNEVLVEQDPAMIYTFAVSDVVDYKAGDVLNVNQLTRTGLLRLRAADEKADKSYAKIRTTIETPVKAYRPADSSVYTEGEPLKLVRVKEISGGGVGFAEDMQLIGSDKHPVKITLDYLDANDNVLNTKTFAEDFIVNRKDTTTVSFLLNNPEERVIVDYKVEIGSTAWDNQTYYPSVPVVVPDGYRYVKPEEDLTAIFNEMRKDDSLDAIRIFLKASGNYTLSDAALSDVPKSVSILGQEPGYGQTQASLTIGTMTFVGNLDEIRFENLSLKSGARFFNIRNQAFNVGEVAFVDCTMDGWTATLWNQATNTDNQQTVGTLRLEGCRLTNYAPSNPLINLPTNKLAPISNFVFRNNVVHGKDFATKTVLLTKLTKMTNPISIVVEGNSFIDTKGTAFTYFDIDAKAASACTLTVKDNVVSGVKSSNAVWFKLGKTSSITASGNTRTAGYEMNYGIEAPAEIATTYQELLKSLNL